MNKLNIERLVNENLRLSEIGDLYGVSRQTVSRFCNKNGIDYKNRKTRVKVTNYIEHEIRDLYNYGFSISEISKIYDIASTTIRRNCNIEIKTVNISPNQINDLVKYGFLLYEVAELCNCTVSQLQWILKDTEYNFRNHKAQREKQSKFMIENNPVVGSRPQYILDAMMNGYIEKSKLNRENKMKNGITFKEYASYSRYDAYVKLKGSYDSKHYSIDHIFTIKDCWDNKVPLELVSHDNNLQILTNSDNKSKASSSEISFNDFLKLIGVQRLSKSQLNWKRVE